MRQARKGALQGLRLRGSLGVALLVLVGLGAFWAVSAVERGRSVAQFAQPKAASQEVGAVYPLYPPPGPFVGSTAGWAPQSYVDSGPPLLFVDHEGVPGPGLLAKDLITGSVRLFSYVVPKSPVPLAIAWVLHNRGAASVRVTVTDMAAASPAHNYLTLAASVQQAFLAGSGRQSFTIAPGQIHVLRDASTDPSSAGDLAFSIYDLATSGPVAAMEIASTDLGSLTTGNLPTQYSAGGGKTAMFPHDSRALSVRFNGTAIADIAGGLSDDPGMVAPDLITGNTDTNLANYGVTYHVSLIFPAGPSRSVDLWVTARGCPLVADVQMHSGPLRGRVTRLPTLGSLPVGPLGTSLAPLHIPGGRQVTFGFDFLPPAGACTPFVVRANSVNPDSSVVQLYQRAVWPG